MQKYSVVVRHKHNTAFYLMVVARGADGEAAKAAAIEILRTTLMLAEGIIRELYPASAIRAVS